MRINWSGSLNAVQNAVGDGMLPGFNIFYAGRPNLHVVTLDSASATQPTITTSVTQPTITIIEKNDIT